MMAVTLEKRFHSFGALIRRSKKTILLIIIVVAITLLVSGIISIILDGGSLISLPSVGNIHTIGVKAYWDQALQNQTTGINWGTVYPGQPYNLTLYLQSVSNVPTTLDMTTANWTYINTNNTITAGPTENTPYINLTWDYNNQTLNPNETIQTTLTLTTDSSSGFITFLINNNIKQVTMDIIIQTNEQ